MAVQAGRPPGEPASRTPGRDAGPSRVPIIETRFIMAFREESASRGRPAGEPSGHAAPASRGSSRGGCSRSHDLRVPTQVVGGQPTSDHDPGRTATSGSRCPRPTRSALINPTTHAIQLFTGGSGQLDHDRPGRRLSGSPAARSTRSTRRRTPFSFTAVPSGSVRPADHRRVRRQPLVHRDCRSAPPAPPSGEINPTTHASGHRVHHPRRPLTLRNRGDHQRPRRESLDHG